MILLITKGGVLYTYGGEFGGFEKIKKLRRQSRKKMGTVMVMRVITTAIMAVRMVVIAVMT